VRPAYKLEIGVLRFVLNCNREREEKKERKKERKEKKYSKLLMAAHFLLP